MGKRIEFRDDSNLSKVVENYAVTHLPSRLCTVTPTNETSSCKSPSNASATPPPATLLFYVDYLRTPRKVRWLDCGASPPKPADGCNVTDTMHAVTHDICCCRCSQLLIITDSDHGICAYGTKDNRLVWKVKGKLNGMEHRMSPWGVTTDGNGHLFICDMRNECIQVFSVSDGKYEGCLLKKGQKGMGVPRCIRWFHENTSLVVAHKEADKRNISVIRIDQKETSSIQTKTTPEKTKSTSKPETTEKKETSPKVEKPCSEQKKSTKGKRQKTSKKEKSSSEKQKSTAQEKKCTSEEQKQTPEETNLWHSISRNHTNLKLAAF